MSQINIYSQNVPIPVDKFDRLYHILEYSFPETERGNYRFHRNEFSRKNFRSMCFEPDGMPAAFLNYYELQDISAVFVEHFASEAASSRKRDRLSAHERTESQILIHDRP